MIHIKNWLQIQSDNSTLYKLNEKDKEKLLALDKEYGELVNMYRNDYNTKDVANMDEECKKIFRS